MGLSVFMLKICRYTYPRNIFLVFDLLFIGGLSHFSVVGFQATLRFQIQCLLLMNTPVHLGLWLVRNHFSHGSNFCKPPLH